MKGSVCTARSHILYSQPAVPGSIVQPTGTVHIELDVHVHENHCILWYNFCDIKLIAFQKQNKIQTCIVEVSDF